MKNFKVTLWRNNARESPAKIVHPNHAKVGTLSEKTTSFLLFLSFKLH